MKIIFAITSSDPSKSLPIIQNQTTLYLPKLSDEVYVGDYYISYTIYLENYITPVLIHATSNPFEISVFDCRVTADQLIPPQIDSTTVYFGQEPVIISFDEFKIKN